MRLEQTATGNVRLETHRDPRLVLVREKYFSLRPKPLEQWLWRQNVPPSAERIFWLHWEEGMRSGDWCSQVPLKRVAAQTCLDLSTVTRAYQLLVKLGLVRRADPGRDPHNPFQQATAVTEVRVPRELLIELDRHPSRPSRGRSGSPQDAPAAAQAPTLRQTAPTEAGGAQTAVIGSESASDGAKEGARTSPSPVSDPFAGLTGRERVRALGALRAKFSAGECSQYDEALRTHRARLDFDVDTKLEPEERGKVLQMLERLAAQPRAEARPVPQSVATSTHASGPRRLSVFELARLRREVHGVTGRDDAPEVVRQVVWSIEEGALRRFSTLHALHIALKKIREGAWTRPNRMPPNWMRVMATPTGSLTRTHAAPETCRSA